MGLSCNWQKVSVETGKREKKKLSKQQEEQERIRRQADVCSPLSLLNTFANCCNISASAVQSSWETPDPIVPEKRVARFCIALLRESNWSFCSVDGWKFVAMEPPSFERPDTAGRCVSICVLPPAGWDSLRKHYWRFLWIHWSLQVRCPSTAKPLCLHRMTTVFYVI